MSKEKSSEKKEVVKRYRNFTAIVYPDCVNTPSNWMDILRDLQLQFFISPLHDKDLNPTGELKKPHYHVILMFDSTKTREQAIEVFDTVGAVVPPKIADKDMFIVSSLRATARYLCHIDNPDKYLYPIEKVSSIGGADYISIIEMACDKYTALTEMEEFCEKYNVMSFFALCRYASLHRQDWSKILKDSGSIYMREYLQSRKWSIENNCADIIDTETGEKLI